MDTPPLKAIWSRAGLMVRLQPPKGASALWWTRSLTMDEARALIRELNTAVDVGQQHLNELKEQKQS